MKSIIAPFLFSLACLSFTGKEPVKAIKEFKEWYLDNAQFLRQQVKAENIIFQLEYLPKELTIVREIMNLQEISGKELEALNKKYDGLEEYSFRIENTRGNDLLLSESIDKADYGSKLFYLIEDVQYDFVIVRDGDTISPLRCDFENNYGNAPYIKLHLVFEKPQKLVKEQSLYYSDRIFGNGTLRYDLSHLTNLQIPKIK